MTDLTAATNEVFQILRSFDYTVMLYNEDGNRVEDPAEASRMFARPANLLVSLVNDGDNSAIRLFLGERTPVTAVLGLIQTLRTSASKFNLLFNVRQFGKEISAKDIAAGAMTEAKKDGAIMNILEGMYGTSKSSYLKFEGVDGGRGARMIVRHSSRIDDSKPGARGRFVESIFIESPRGERLLFPTTQMAPARAMTQHVNNGGSFTDQVGSHIQRMATDYANLGAVTRHIKSHAGSLRSEAVSVQEACKRKMRESRHTFNRMFRQAGYMAECQKITEMASALTEDGRATDEVAPMEIEEMRGLLAVKGVEVADCLCEAACRARRTAQERTQTDGMDTMTEVMDEIDEGAREVILPTVSVVGHPVERDAWDELCNGKIDLFRRPDADENPRYTNKSAELLHKLGLLVPVVRNNSMLNLLSHIANRLPEERDPTMRSKMQRIALAALRAANMGLNEGIAAKNTVIREFADWIGDFRIERILAEDGLPPRHLMGRDPYDDEADFEEVVDWAMDRFDPQEFASEFLADNYDAADEHESHLVSKDYLLSCIEHKLIEIVHSHEDGITPHSLPHEAAALLPAVERALMKLNFRLGAPELVEGMELSREDILLPQHNQAMDLRREVVKPEVEDPIDHTEEDPDGGYLARLRTLSGL